MHHALAGPSQSLGNTWEALYGRLHGAAQGQTTNHSLLFEGPGIYFRRYLFGVS